MCLSYFLFTAQALVLVQQVIASDPTQPEPVFLRAQALYYKAATAPQLQEAIEEFRHALLLCPDGAKYGAALKTALALEVKRKAGQEAFVVQFEDYRVC
jgi:hypothetical protein